MNLWNQMQDLDKRAVTEKRDLSQDEKNQWDKMEADISQFDKDIEREEKRMRLAALDSEKEAREQEDRIGKVSAQMGVRERRKIFEKRELGESLTQQERDCATGMDRYKAAFDNLLLRGLDGISQEERNLITNEVERRALSSDATTGSYLVPEQYSYEIERVQILQGGMLEACRVVRSAKGGPLPWPTNDDTANAAEWLAQNNTATADTDATLGLTTFNDYTVSSGPIKVSEQLVHDSAFSIDDFVTTIAGERIGRKTNNGFTVGTGTTHPLGLFTSGQATVGKQTAAANAITYDELIDMIHSINPIYRKKPTPANFKAAGAFSMNATHTGWMFNDATLAVIRKLKDDQNRPLWEPSVQVGVPDMLLGYRYIVNPDVASIASNALVAAFGDFSGYMIRKVEQSGVKRLVERYAEAYQIAWLLFERWDGKIINTSKVKTLKMAA